MKRKQEETAVTDTSSKVVAKTELDLFADPLEQQSIEQSYKMEYSPLGTITESGPICFQIPKGEALFTDLSQCFLEVTLRVLKANGAFLTEEDRTKIQPCNNFFDALFSRVTLLLNSNIIGSDGEYHPQISLAKNLLTYSHETLTSTLNQAIGWYKDFAYPYTEPNIRHPWIARSKTTTFLGRLTDNFFTAKNLLLPNVVDVNIILHRSAPHFCLIRSAGITDEYKIQLHNCTLIARRVKLNKATFSHLEAQLARGAMAKYSYYDTVARTTQIGIGMQNWHAHNMFTGKLPSRILLGICESIGTAGGSYENNPMIFPSSHFGVNYVQFFVNTIGLLKRPYQPDFCRSESNRSYMGLLEAARVLSHGGRIGITSEEFNMCYGLFGYDLTADGSNFSHMTEGNLSVEIRFRNNTTVSLSGIVIAEFPKMCRIDKNGDVYSNDL